MRFAHSAFRHGITEQSIRYIVDEYEYADEIDLASNSSNRGLLFVGNDQRGVPLEVIGVIVDPLDGESELLVIHAMPLRRRYRREYERAMAERWG